MDADPVPVPARALPDGEADGEADPEDVGEADPEDVGEADPEPDRGEADPEAGADGAAEPAVVRLEPVLVHPVANRPSTSTPAGSGKRDTRTPRVGNDAGAGSLAHAGPAVLVASWAAVPPAGMPSAGMPAGEAPQVKG
jgi:hypothetical protein